MERAFRAIVIGIEEYDDARAWKTLRGVREAAARVAAAIGVEPLDLPLGGLKDEAPRALKAAINAIPERATLFVHWIGHGVTSGDQHYLVCRDSPGPGRLDSYEAIPSGELGRMLATSRAERVVVVLDTCFSGEGAGNLAQRYRDSLARELEREGWERVACVIAASHPLDKAVAGRFSQGVVEVLEYPDRHLRWTKADAYIDPERLAVAVRDVLGEENKAVYPRFSKEGIGQDIIPNPLFRPAPGNTDLETHRRLEGVFGERAHFNLAARGIETGEAGYFFTGRHRCQQEILDWLSSPPRRLMIVTGPPGSGKSALIGRIVTLSVPGVREELRSEGALGEGEPVPTDNAVDVAIHAKGKSVFQVASGLGHALGLDREVVDQPGIVDMLEKFEAIGERRTIVIDALDEAVSGQAQRIANEIIRPLSVMSGVRVLVGTRRSLDGALIPGGEERHGRLIKAFGGGADFLDLEDEPDTEADIAAFVAKRLRSATKRGADAWIADAAARVAAAAAGSFLYARLVARSLEATPDAPLDSLPADASAAFVEDIRGRFPEDIARVTDMLRALAFGLGLGLSRAVWPSIASALSDSERVYTQDDVVWMLRNVGSYLVETTVETDGIGQAVYRLIHQALADYLQRESDLSSQTKIVDALTRGLEGEAWLAADPYLRRHLVQHAVLADRLGLGQVAQHVIQVPWDKMSREERRGAGEEMARFSELERMIATPGVLAIADPATVIATRIYLLSNLGRHRMGIYQLAAVDLPGLGPAERWAVMHLKTIMQGDTKLAEAWVPPDGARFRALWARTRPVTPHLALVGHWYPVWCLASGAIGGRSVIVSGGEHGTVQLWDAQDCSPLGPPLQGHAGTVASVALGEVDGRAVIVSGSFDTTVRLWDARDGSPIGAPLAGHEYAVTSVALGEIGGRAVIVSGSYDRTLRIWDARDGNPLGAPLQGHADTVTSVALGEVDGRVMIVSGSEDQTVRLWDAQDRSPLGAPLEGHEGWVTSVALGEVDHRTVIVSGGADKTVRLWDATDGSPLGAPLAGHQLLVTSVAMGEIGGRPVIVSGSYDRTVRLWDARDGSPRPAVLAGHEGSVTSVALCEVGGRTVIVSGSWDGSARLWDVPDGSPLGAPLEGPECSVTSVALGYIDGRPVIVSGGGDQTVRLWHAADGSVLGGALSGHDGWVTSVALGYIDGRAVIVSGGADQTVRLWDAEGGNLLGGPLAGHEGWVTSVALAEVRGRAVIVSGSADQTVRLWDAHGGSLIGVPVGGHADAITSVALGEIDGRTVIVTGSEDQTVRLWNAQDGSPIGAPLEGHADTVTSVALGQVGGRVMIVSGSEDQTVRLWDAQDGSPLGAPLEGHEGWVTSVALGEMGGPAVIVSGSDDGTVRMWDAYSGTAILAVPIGQTVHSIALAGDDRLAVGTPRGLIMLKLRL